MRAVVEGYRASGIFKRWSVDWIAPHVEGSLSLRLRTAASGYFTLLKRLFGGQVALVHIHAAMRGSFWRKSVFAVTACMFRVPVIFHMHGSETDKFINAQPEILRRLIATILRRVSCVVVLSSSWKTYIEGVSPSARVVILPNYVPMPNVAVKPAHADGAPVTFLFLGAIGTRKGVYPMLEAFAKAKRMSSVPMTLRIGGSGELEKAKQAAISLGIADSVEFLGWVVGDAKLKLLEEADVYVLPSFHEGLPVSILEAMSYGVPVLSTRVGGIPELVREGLDGYLVEAGKVDDLADRMARLAADAALRRAMGASGRERVQANYSEAMVVPALEALYTELTTQRRAK
ncbi:glycosyltransferase family 4 protein [Ideonella margarita]|uniref:Glycosyltransferase family 4 protein n=1 Tax=Ideonella margarita TaxID=2984191 RepID=A0ABU9C1E4_9BURK